MKCLFVHDHIYLGEKGRVYSNTFSYETLKRYVDIFGEVTVVARYREAKGLDMPEAGGIGVSFIFLKSISSAGSFFGLRQQYQKRIEKLIEEHQAVIVRLPSEFGLLTAKIAHKKQRRYLAEVVGCGWDAMWHYGGWQSKVYAPYFFWKMKSAVRKADYVSYVTQHFLQRRYPFSATARTISLSDVVVSSLDESIVAERIVKIRRVKKKIILGTIANLDIKYKGIDIAIEAVNKLRKDHFEIEYHILGAGNPLPLEKIADKFECAKSIYFDGVLPSGKPVQDWLDKVDIYLQPSYQEGLPRSLIEAMSRACPAIGSAAGGIPELLDTRMIVSAGSPARLAGAIEELLGSRQMMIEAARRNFALAKNYQQEELKLGRKRFLLTLRSDMAIGETLREADTFAVADRGE